MLFKCIFLVYFFVYSLLTLHVLEKNDTFTWVYFSVLFPLPLICTCMFTQISLKNWIYRSWLKHSLALLLSAKTTFEYHEQIKYVPEAMHLPAIKLLTQAACRMTTFTVASCLCNGILKGTYNLMVCSCM